ncbi:MAG: hypothetical protein LCH30_10295 [Proteobacteria bacterium]|nr:hypothetical protein [Pseudomonadota bacterium]
MDDMDDTNDEINKDNTRDGANVDNTNNISGNGNFCINNTGSIHFNPLAPPPFNEFTQLKETGVKNIIQRESVKGKIRQRSIFAGVSLFVAIIADCLNIAQFLGVEGPRFLPELLVLFILSFCFFWGLNGRLWGVLFEGNPKNTFMLYKGKYYFLSSDRKYVEEPTLFARCIYPFCNGQIFLKAAPPREKDKNIIGCCSIDEKNHTYICDNNLVLYKCPIDWRPIPNNKTQ